MSIFNPITVACPNCDTDNEFDIFSSVNADRRPDLREAIIGGSFERVKCRNCGTDFRPEPNLNYLDSANGLWIMALPIDALAHWKDEEAEAQASFDEAYGSGAPASAREIGDELTSRVTFGWPAFREKLIITQEKLDDLAVEKTKIAILSNKPGNPLRPGVELRLLAVHDPVFHMGWVTVNTNEAVEVFEVQRALYAEIAGDAAWNEIGSTISSGMFVDIQRMFILPQPKEPAEAAE